MPRFYYNEMKLEAPESVYYPREDSLLLAKAVEYLDLKGKDALEIGCGCGFLSILMAKKGASVNASDINPEAVKATKRNAEVNGVELACSVSDLFSNVNSKFDLIMFNPPYLPEDADAVGVNENPNIPRQWSGGPTGRETIERFINGAKSRLNPGGLVLLLISSLTGEKEVIDIFAKQDMPSMAIEREKIPWEELIVIKAANYAVA